MRTLRKRIKPGETYKESIEKTENVFSVISEKTDKNKNEKLETIVLVEKCSRIKNDKEFLNHDLDKNSEQREAMKLVDQRKTGDINNEAQVVANDSEHLKLSSALKCNKRKCRQEKINPPEEIEAERLARLERQRKYRQEKKGVYKTFKERFNSLTPEQQEAYRLRRNQRRKDFLQKLKAENKLELLEAQRAKKNDYNKQHYRLRRKIDQTQNDLNEIKRNKKKITEEELELRRSKRKLSAQNFRRRRKQFEATRDNIVQQLRENQKEDTKSVESESFELLLNQAEIKISPDDLKYTSAELSYQRYKKRKSSFTPEQLKAFKIKCNLQQKKYREQKKAILKKSLELVEHNRELSAEEKEVLKLAEEIKHQKLKISERRKKRLDEKRNTLVKETIEHRQNNTNANEMMVEHAAGSPMTNHQKIQNQCYKYNPSNMKTEKVKLVERKSSEFLNQDSEQKEALKLTDQIKTGDVKNETQVVANDSEHLKLSAAQKYTEKYQAYLQRRKIYLKEYRQRQKIKDPPEKVEARRLDNIEKQRQYREETKRQKECGQIRKPEDTPEKKEARRLKKNYKNRQYRLRLKQKIDQSKTGLNSEKGGLNNSKKNTYKAKQRFNSLTPEQQEAFRIKRNKRQQRYRDQDKSILKKSLKLLKEKRELSAEEREVLILAEKIKKLKSKVLERRKQRLKEKRNALIKETITHRQNNTKGAGSLMTNHQEAYRLRRNQRRKDFLQKLKAENKLELLEAQRAKKNDYNKQHYRLRRKIDQTQNDLNEIKRNKKKITEEELELRRSKRKLSAQNFRRRRKQFEATRDNIVQQLRENQKEDTKSVESESFELLLNQAEIKISPDDLKYTSAELSYQRYKKRKSSFTPEQLKAFKIKCNLQQKKYREQKKAILKKSLELVEHNRELSAEEKEVLKLAEEIKHQKLKISERRKKRLDEKRNTLVKETIEHRQNNTNANEMMVEHAAGSPMTNHQKIQNQCYKYNPSNMKTEKVKLVERKSSEFLNQDSEQKEALKLTDQIKTGDVKNETQVVANDSEHLKLSAAQKYTEKYQAYLQRRKIYLKEYRQRQKIKDPPEKVEARRLDNIEKQRQYREETKRQKECGQIRKPEDTPEKKEARRLKKNYKNRQYRLRLKQKIDQSKTGLNSEKGGLNNSKKNTYKAKQRFNSLTPEQQEAFRIKRNKRQQRYRDQDKSILKKSLKLLKEKRELSAEEREVLILAEKIKKLKSKVLERRKQRLKEKRNALIKETITHRQNNTKGAGSLMTNHQPTSSFPPIVEDEIEIEKKVIQQNLIKAIPKRLTETLNDSSCSWLQPSQESFSTDGTHTFHGDSTISKSFLDGSSSHHSNKIERRKTVIDESFSCMRAVIDATAKGDRFVMFGKHIAQKIRSHKKGEAEINIAKLLIDNVLQNLSIGIYKSEF